MANYISKNIPGELSARLKELTKAGFEYSEAIDKIFAEVTGKLDQKFDHVAETRVANGITTLKEYFKFYKKNQGVANDEVAANLELSMAKLNILLMGYTTSDFSRKAIGKLLTEVLKNATHIDQETLTDSLNGVVESLNGISPRGYDTSYRFEGIKTILRNFEIDNSQGLSGH